MPHDLSQTIVPGKIKVIIVIDVDRVNMEYVIYTLANCLLQSSQLVSYQIAQPAFVHVTKLCSEF